MNPIFEELEHPTGKIIRVGQICVKVGAQHRGARKVELGELKDKEWVQLARVLAGFFESIGAQLEA